MDKRPDGRRLYSIRWDGGYDVRWLTDEEVEKVIRKFHGFVRVVAFEDVKPEPVFDYDELAQEIYELARGEDDV